MSPGLGDAKTRNSRGEKLKRVPSTTPEREVGWVEAPHGYVGPTRQLAIRKPEKGSTWHYRVLVFNLADDLLCALAGQQLPSAPLPVQIALAALYAYDQRGGGVETSVKDSKQGLGLTKRNKRGFVAQEMLVLLAQLAYNAVLWTRATLAARQPQLRPLGMVRMIRDLFHISGKLQFDAQGRLVTIRLNKAHLLAPPFAHAVSSLLAQDGIRLYLGQI
jgi:hypothetical protein